MCMFNDKPPANRNHLSKPKWAWKVFRKDRLTLGGLAFPWCHYQTLHVGGWMTAVTNYSGETFGFHVFNTLLGAWVYKRSVTYSGNRDEFCIRRVRIQGEICGVGRECGFKGMRVSQMLVPA